MKGAAVFFAAFDLPSSPASAGISWPDVALSFFAIVLEGAPFLLLGAIISGLVDVFLPAGLVKDALPRSKMQGVFAAMGAGIIFPLCECGAMPIVQRLIRKGVPAAVATTYMLAAPALNPLALIGTYLAFRSQDPWLMVVLRFSLSAVVLVFLGLWLVRLRPENMLRAETLIGSRPHPEQSPNPGLILTPRPGLSLGGLQQFTGAVIRDFTGVLLFLIIGAGRRPFSPPALTATCLRQWGRIFFSDRSRGFFSPSCSAFAARPTPSSSRPLHRFPSRPRSPFSWPGR